MSRIETMSFALVFLLFVTGANADSLWDKTKSVTKGAVDTAEGVARTVGDAVSGEEVTPEQARSEIDQMAAAALDRLFKESAPAKQQYEQSAGYAVFDTRKFSFMITTGVGAGVAVDKKSGQRTYMKMATGGANLGAGAEFFQLIFLFPTTETMQEFVTNGWSAGSDVDAKSGKEGMGLGVRLANGVIVHELSKSGLALSATLTGTRYWLDEKLN